MAVNYHINIKTGRPNQCKASSPEKCPYFDKETNTPAPHFDNKPDARKYIEKELNKEYKNTQSLSKKVLKNSSSKKKDKLKYIEADKIMKKENEVLEKIKGSGEDFVEFDDYSYDTVKNLVHTGDVDYHGNDFERITLYQVYNEKSPRFVWKFIDKEAPSDYQIIHSKNPDGSDRWNAFTKFNVEYESKDYDTPEECFPWFEKFTDAYKKGEITY